MDKRSVIAIVLIAALWMVYFVVFKPDETARKQVVKKVEEPRKDAGKLRKEDRAPVAISAVTRSGDEKLINIQTKKFAFKLSNRGAAITACNYIERNIDLIVGMNPYGASGPLDFALHFDDEEFLSGNALQETLWNYRQEGNRVFFQTDFRMNGVPVRLEKIYTFKDEGYGFHLEYRMKNNGRNAVTFA
ncbi:MAG: hypothetical protein E4G96_07710, partial [Chrysiogenales bacterium]